MRVAIFCTWGSPPNGAHFGPKKGYIPGSLFKQARYNIVICAILYRVIEYAFYKKYCRTNCPCPFLTIFRFLSCFFTKKSLRNSYSIKMFQKMRWLKSLQISGAILEPWTPWMPWTRSVLQSMESLVGKISEDCGVVKYRNRLLP